MASESDVTVVGAGAFGLCTALELARRRLQVTLYDQSVGESASDVAAGMLAPAFESLLDGQPGTFPLLAAARDLWPSLLKRLGASFLLDRAGALWAGDDAEGVVERLGAIGARAEPLSGEEARRRQPGLSLAIETTAWSPEDWRLEVPGVTVALRQAALSLGVEIVPERLSPDARPPGPVVVAVGAGAGAWAGAARELAALTPIKGQLLRVGTPFRGPVLRAEGVYVAPRGEGAVVGATMEAGRADLAIDPAALEVLRARAVRIAPEVAWAPGEGAAGVRMSTPDGLPLAGPSEAEGVFLAAGARRNGWLFAPLVAAQVAAYLTGDDPGPHAAALDPRRFARAG